MKLQYLPDTTQPDSVLFTSLSGDAHISVRISKQWLVEHGITTEEQIKNALLDFSFVLSYNERRIITII